MQTNGFPFFLLAILFIVVNVVVNVVSQFWKAITTFLPCINALPCFREEADYEGVPTFEDAFMMDKLIGAHTYEMREMPMYKKFFFEGKGGFKERAAGDQADPDTPFKKGEDPYNVEVDDDTDDEDTMADIAAMLGKPAEPAAASGGARRGRRRRRRSRRRSRRRIRRGARWGSRRGPGRGAGRGPGRRAQGRRPGMAPPAPPGGWGRPVSAPAGTGPPSRVGPPGAG